MQRKYSIRKETYILIFLVTLLFTIQFTTAIGFASRLDELLKVIGI